MGAAWKPRISAALTLRAARLAWALFPQRMDALPHVLGHLRIAPNQGSSSVKGPGPLAAAPGWPRLVADLHAHHSLLRERLSQPDLRRGGRGSGQQSQKCRTAADRQGQQDRPSSAAPSALRSRSPRPRTPRAHCRGRPDQANRFSDDRIAAPCGAAHYRPAGEGDEARREQSCPVKVCRLGRPAFMGPTAVELCVAAGPGAAQNGEQSKRTSRVVKRDTQRIAVSAGAIILFSRHLATLRKATTESLAVRISNKYSYTSKNKFEINWIESTSTISTPPGHLPAQVRLHPPFYWAFFPNAV